MLYVAAVHPNRVYLYESFAEAARAENYHQGLCWMNADEAESTGKTVIMPDGSMYSDARRTKEIEKLHKENMKLKPKE